MDKYSDLPDIDRDGQEVFESSDIESELELSAEEPHVENINRNKIDIEQSRERFVHSEIIDGNSYDFLGNVSKLNGYNVSHVEETIEEKLARISRELEEIRLGPHDDTPSNKKQVNQLLEVLDELKSSQVQEDTSTVLSPECLNINSVFEKVIPPQNSSVISATQVVNVQKLISLEERLNQVESSIGGNEDPSKPLSLTINELSRKISIIENPEYNFEVIQSEINKLDKELEQLELKKKVLNLGNDDENVVSSITKSKPEKLDEVYEKLPTINRYNAIAPKLLARLKTLTKVHQEMETNVNLSASIDQTLQDLESDMKNWDASIDKLNENLVSYEKSFDENSKSVNERISDLILKVESLSTE